MVANLALCRVTVVPLMDATLLSELAKVTTRPLLAVATSVTGDSARELAVREAKVMVWLPMPEG